MQRTQTGAPDRAVTLEDNTSALQNEQMMYAFDKNYRNLSLEERHQRKMLKDYFNNVFVMARGHDLRCDKELLQR